MTATGKWIAVADSFSGSSLRKVQNIRSGEFLHFIQKTERISALDRHGASEDISKTAISEDT
jgi:hypothetical protein